MASQSIVSSELLALQLCLGFWQIGKLTPVGALIQCLMGWLLLPLGLSQLPYNRLKRFPGRVYKEVRCHVTTPSDQPMMPRQIFRNDMISNRIDSSYLGVDFLLERRERYMLYLNGKLTYYITDAIWYSLLDMGEAAPKTVFLEGYKEFWQQVATGGVMSLSEVLDRLILDNHSIKVLDNDLLLPVNVCVSDEKLLKFLNLVGLFLRTKQVYWVIPTSISLAAAAMEFATVLREWLYGKVNLLFCFIMHVICDRLPRSMRREVYSLGNWVENLKPSNDIELRVVRGPVCGVIGGGAKVYHEGATLVPWLHQEYSETQKTFNCGDIDPEFPFPIDIECYFDAVKGKCHLRARTVALADVDCDRDEFMKIVTFSSCMAKNRSGSLRSCSSNNKVRVRGFRESVLCYAKNGFPPVYELNLENALVY